MYFTSHSISAMEGIRAINAAITLRNMQQLRTIIEKYEKHSDFRSGENIQYIYYGKALCAALLDKDYNTSLEYCFKRLRVESPSFEKGISHSIKENNIRHLADLLNIKFVILYHQKNTRKLANTTIMLILFIN